MGDRMGRSGHDESDRAPGHAGSQINARKFGKRLLALGSDYNSSDENVSFITKSSTQRMETVTPDGVVALPTVRLMGVFGFEGKPSGTWILICVNPAI
jgi:hypothetical protein